MQQIINFLIRNKNNILFLLLFAFSLFLTIQSHSFQKSKFISSANFISGGIYGWSSGIKNYMHLDEYNQRLLDENQLLRNRLASYEDTLEISQFRDSLFDTQLFRYKTAEVINNNFSKIDNYITLNRGSKDGLRSDMGVVTSKGIVGIVENVSAHYATVISILNSNSRINAKLTKSEHFGSLVWNGEDPNIVQLIDVPALAPISQGDTIVTGGQSLIFPEGIPIGVIVGHSLDRSESYYTINVSLFNDMTNIGYVYIIEHTQKNEILDLQETTVNE